MSLDDRLRSGLRTLADPMENTEQHLVAFRERAYPRRARRRILEGIGTAMVFAAIAVGVGVLVNTTFNKPDGYIQRPEGIPNCKNDDLRINAAYGAGPTMVIEYTYTSVRRACWVDQDIQLTITRNGPPDQAAAGRLAVVGNGSTVHLRGVAPVMDINQQPTPGSRVLGARWAWTNWCGHDKYAFFTFKPLGDAFNYTFRGDYTQTNATCTDRSKPSTLQPLGQVTEMVEASPFAS